MFSIWMFSNRMHIFLNLIISQSNTNFSNNSRQYLCNYWDRHIACCWHSNCQSHTRCSAHIDDPRSEFGPQILWSGKCTQSISGLQWRITIRWLLVKSLYFKIICLLMFFLLYCTFETLAISYSLEMEIEETEGLSKHMSDPRFIATLKFQRQLELFTTTKWKSGCFCILPMLVRFSIRRPNRDVIRLECFGMRAMSRIFYHM